MTIHTYGHNLDIICIFTSRSSLYLKVALWLGFREWASIFFEEMLLEVGSVSGCNNNSLQSLLYPENHFYRILATLDVVGDANVGICYSDKMGKRTSIGPSW